MKRIIFSLTHIVASLCLFIMLAAVACSSGSRLNVTGGQDATTTTGAIIDGGIKITVDAYQVPTANACDGSISIVIKGNKANKDNSDAASCSTSLSWAAEDAPVETPPPVPDYACPAGSVRVHFKDVWSQSATPTLNTMTSPPLALEYVNIPGNWQTAASASPDGVACGWYSACLPTSVTIIGVEPVSSVASTTCPGTQGISGEINLASAMATGDSDIWISDQSATITQAQYGAAPAATTAFTVTSNGTHIDPSCVGDASADAGSTTPTGFVKLHIRWMWADPTVTGYPGTACGATKGFPAPPYPSSLWVRIGGCQLPAMLDDANSDCPWYTAYIPTGMWTANPNLTVGVGDPGNQTNSLYTNPLPASPATLTTYLNPTSTGNNEIWLAYAGAADNVSWAGEGQACQNYSLQSSAYFFYTSNPGPGYAGCGGGNPATIDPCEPPLPTGYHHVHFRYIWAGQKTFTFFPKADFMPTWIILENQPGGNQTICTREADRPWFNCPVPDSYFVAGATWRADDKVTPTINQNGTEWNTVINRPFPDTPGEYWIRWFYGKPDIGFNGETLQQEMDINALSDFKIFTYNPDESAGDWSATGVWNDSACAAYPPTSPPSVGYGAWFPYSSTNYAYPFGTSLARTYPEADTVQQLFNYLVWERYQVWKANYVSFTDDVCGPGTARVERIDYSSSNVRTFGQDTVSEGQGYGMAISAAIGDKTTFDALWNFTRHYLTQSAKKYCGGLMGWIWNGNGSGGAQDSCRPIDTPCDSTTESCPPDSAFDGDVDIAIGLVFAARQWPEYTEAAVSWLLKMECEVDNKNPPLYYPAPGDTWNNFNCSGQPGSPCTYPVPGNGTLNMGYYPPGYFRVFGDFLQANLDPSQYTPSQHHDFWYKTAQSVYDLYELCYNNNAVNAGLLTDWGHYQTPCDANSDNYNWSRGLWRVGVDAAWFGNRTDLPENVAGSSTHYSGQTEIQAKIGNMQNFYNNFYVNNPPEKNANMFSTICQNLDPSGTVKGCDPSLGHNSYFVGTAMCPYVSIFDDGGQTTPNIRQQAIEEAISTALENDHYYQESIGVYTLLFLTGNFPNPMEVP